MLVINDKPMLLSSAIDIDMAHVPVPGSGPRDRKVVSRARWSHFSLRIICSTVYSIIDISTILLILDEK